MCLIINCGNALRFFFVGVDLSFSKLLLMFGSSIEFVMLVELIPESLDGLEIFALFNNSMFGIGNRLGSGGSVQQERKPFAGELNESMESKMGLCTGGNGIHKFYK